MLSGDEKETKPAKKSASRKARIEQEAKRIEQEARKAEPRKRKSAPRKDAQQEPVLEAAETTDVPVASPASIVADASPEEAVAALPVTAVETDQGPSLQPDQTPEAAEIIGAPVTALVPVVFDTPSPVFEESTALPAVPAVAEPVSYQTIADAYRRYTTESLDRTQTFFGRLAGVRSLDKAFELQAEFASQAYDGFVAESRRIRELHSQLARERLQQWEGFVARMMSTR